MNHQRRRWSVTPPRPQQGSARESPSHRRHILPVLDRQDDARAIVEAGAVFFGPVVDALARGDFAFAQEGLTDRLAEFRCSGFCRFQRRGDDALEDFEGVVSRVPINQTARRLRKKRLDRLAVLSLLPGTWR